VFNKILVANRGEIAMRVIRAARELGIQSVAVHSTADAESLHVKFADEAVCIGPPNPAESYLDIPSIIAAAEMASVDAIHPGYGFLSENAKFADICNLCGFTFIGPAPDIIRTMGDKIQARATMKAAGLPILPGCDEVETEEEALSLAREIGCPLIIKASAGGGGRGMKIVRSEEEIPNALKLARHEAITNFGNGALYMERYVQKPRHIEFQVAADIHGNVVHFGERECSVQRRHQKLIEEAPSPIITLKKRRELGDIIVKALRHIGYTNVGTVEMLMDENEELYFMEMNTRIQVEHPVTEQVTGVDLIRLQIELAAERPLPYQDNFLQPKGHAIECRINAEDPENFAPSPGTISAFHVPGGLGVRVDTFVTQDSVIHPHYDSLIAKLIVHDHNRAAAINRMKSALSEFVVEGIKSNIPFHRRVMEHEDFINGQYDTHIAEKILG
jgi:acetyl-CoA carboxylase biotin carboxylase subunit